MRMNPSWPPLSLCIAALLLPSALAAQSITISPSYATIGVDQTQQYKATVAGLANTKVTWQVNGITKGNHTYGTITAAGLYTAPAKIPANGITITALGSDNKTSATVYIAVEPAGPTILSVSPSPIPVGTYNITLTGTNFKKGAIVCGADANLPTTFVNKTTLTAGGYQGAAGSAAFKVQNPGTLWGPIFVAQFVNGGPPPPQTISPMTATVKLGGTEQFTSPGATSWSATAGSVSSSGLYTAPSTMPSSNSATVTATGPGGSASAMVTLTVQNPQTISPTTVSLALGATQQFTAPGAISWAATYGSVTTSGLYTAPTALSASDTDSVSATSTNGTATATVTLIPPTPVITAVGSNGQLPLGIFTTTIAGTGFIASSIASINGTAMETAISGGLLNVTGFWGTSGSANITVSNGGTVSQPFPVQIGVANAQVSAAAARRFLEQAAFGPTPSDADNVQTLGFQGWLTQQFNMPQVSNYNNVTSSQSGMPGQFLANAVTNGDQLRQRVAFALSQIFVTSLQTLIWNSTMVPYQNMLLADAFTDYQQIMNDVTLSPAMGQYLNMANNAMADPATGSVANENYARELMQLFTIGVQMLNQDGTVQLDNTGLPIPAYSQFTITEFARVYTGWTYPPPPGQPVDWNSYISTYGPMVPYPAQHDSGSKQLLNGYLSPAGISPQQDLANAISNVFNHPNVGPFVGTQLIQHLVKSNPSPAYVSRVAAAFNNNGSGVRGDMQAVITAILLDPEARANDNGGNDQPTDGHLQEPALFFAGMIRAFGGQMSNQNDYPWDLVNLDQDIFNPPSVFNYYAPNFVVPGTALFGGEFEIQTPNNAIWRADDVSTLFSQWSTGIQNYGPGTTVDITPFVALAATPATLVNALDLTLTHGTMPSGMKSIIVSAVSGDADAPLQVVEHAIYLILSSSYYNIWH
jgi:uncharacterized protein (DUF1800 family)